MTISTWLMIVALATGVGTGQSISSGSATSAFGEPPEGSCWVNGIWVNPCPDDIPFNPTPQPTTEKPPA